MLIVYPIKKGMPQVKGLLHFMIGDVGNSGGDCTIYETYGFNGISPRVISAHWAQVTLAYLRKKTVAPKRGGKPVRRSGYLIVVGVERRIEEITCAVVMNLLNSFVYEELPDSWCVMSAVQPNGVEVVYGQLLVHSIMQDLRVWKPTDEIVNEMRNTWHNLCRSSGVKPVSFSRLERRAKWLLQASMSLPETEGLDEEGILAEIYRVMAE